MNEFNYEGWIGSVMDNYASTSEFPDVGSEDTLYIVRDGGTAQAYVWDDETSTYVVLAGGGGGGGGSQSDWNESDASSAAYVKNRTHYDDAQPVVDFDITATITTDPDTSITVSGVNAPYSVNDSWVDENISGFAIEWNNTSPLANIDYPTQLEFEIEYNSQTYEGYMWRAEEYNTVYIFGSPRLSGEYVEEGVVVPQEQLSAPFSVVAYGPNEGTGIDGNSLVFNFATSETFNVKISILEGSLQKLSKKYIPNVSYNELTNKPKKYFISNTSFVKDSFFFKLMKTSNSYPEFSKVYVDYSIESIDGTTVRQGDMFNRVELTANSQTFKLELNYAQGISAPCFLNLLVYQSSNVYEDNFPIATKTVFIPRGSNTMTDGTYVLKMTVSNNGADTYYFWESTS